MAYRNLSTGEMTALSGAWTTPDNAAYLTFQSVAPLAALLPFLTQRHRALVQLDLRNSKGEQDEASAQAAELDRRHDALASGVYSYLSVLSELQDNGQLIKLRDHLMPDGPGAVVQATYRGQAGYAQGVRERLKEEHRSQLSELPMPGGGTVLDKVEEWLDTAQELGHLEEQRTRRAAEADRLQLGELVLARNSWIQAARTLEAVARLVELPPATSDVLFSPLHAAEGIADTRAARRAGRNPRSSDVAPKDSADSDTSTEVSSDVSNADQSSSESAEETAQTA